MCNESEPKFFFTSGGRVQFWEQDGKRGMILTRDRETARKLVSRYKRVYNVKLSIAEIGTVQGETLAIQLNASLTRGANCAFILDSVDDDGMKCSIMEPTSGGDD
jgi:hypothetical protein